MHKINISIDYLSDTEYTHVAEGDLNDLLAVLIEDVQMYGILEGYNFTIQRVYDPPPDYLNDEGEDDYELDAPDEYSLGYSEVRWYKQPLDDDEVVITDEDGV